ncbi:hypothetical protein EMCRGX_G012139 [Ephydatia muelleri]
MQNPSYHSIQQIGECNASPTQSVAFVVIGNVLLRSATRAVVSQVTLASNRNNREMSKSSQKQLETILTNYFDHLHHHLHIITTWWHPHTFQLLMNTPRAIKYFSQALAVQPISVVALLCRAEA